MKTIKKLLFLSLALATVSITAIFADDLESIEPTSTGNSQIYTFLYFYI